MLTIFLLLILKYHLIILNIIILIIIILIIIILIIIILIIIPSSSSCCFAFIKVLSKVFFLYKQVGTEGGMYKAIYKQFIKKVILIMQDLLW